MESFSHVIVEYCMEGIIIFKNKSISHH